MPAFFSGSSGPESADLADDARRMFADLAARRPDRRHLVTGECVPVVDVFETDRTVEIVMDLPDVTADAVRILTKAGVVLIVGEKERPEPSKRASFQLVERDFGCFARVVRVTGAVDTARACARLSQGELRVVLPRCPERRSRPTLVEITSGGPDSK